MLLVCPRRPVAITQELPTDHDLAKLVAWVIVEPPRYLFLPWFFCSRHMLLTTLISCRRDIYDFVGNFYTPRPLRDHFRRSAETPATGVSQRQSLSSPTVKPFSFAGKSYLMGIFVNQLY